MLFTTIVTFMFALPQSNPYIERLRFPPHDVLEQYKVILNQRKEWLDKERSNLFWIYEKDKREEYANWLGSQISQTDDRLSATQTLIHFDWMAVQKEYPQNWETMARILGHLHWNLTDSEFELGYIPIWEMKE
jgi:hypothetical protein